MPARRHGGAPHGYLVARVAAIGGLGMVPALFVRGVGPVALLAALPVVLLIVAAATAIARVLDGDTQALRERAAALTRRSAPPPPPITHAARRLSDAIDTLLERTAQSQVDSFLAAEKLDEERRMKSQLLATMSHELRSPLNSILGFSEFLLRGMEGELADADRPPLRQIQRAGRQLLRLINEILDTAKCESGKLLITPQAMVPAQLIRQAIQETRRARDVPASIEIVTELQPGMEPVVVDPIHFTQALCHLLGHALDVLGQGRILLRVGDRQAAGRRVFAVEMEMAGALPESERELLFVGFRKVSDGNLGLAVPLARRLVELHGGTVMVESAGSSSESNSLTLALLVPEAPRPTRLGVVRTMRSLPAIEAVARRSKHEKWIATVEPTPGDDLPTKALPTKAGPEPRQAARPEPEPETDGE